MKLSEDISQEELAAFLEETDEELKLLDETLIILEKSGIKPEIIQEIFRAAHNLKGSSAMIGDDKMSKIAHAMETVLDKLRSGSLEISTNVINALLTGLDVLKLLRDNLTVGNDNREIDIATTIVELEKIAKKEPAAKDTVINQCVPVDADTSQKLKISREKGYNAYALKIGLDPDSSWIAVRHFQLITELSHIGEVIKSIPSREEIENGKVDANMEMILVCSLETSAIQSAISAIPDVKSTRIERYENTNSAPESIKTKDAGVTNTVPIETTASATKKTEQANDTVRVDVRLLDNLMNLVGEMVIDRNRIRQISRKLEVKYEGDEIVENLGDTSAHMVKLVSDLQENILRARMLHIGTILNGFPRLVRDLSQKANKKIDLIIEGQETELDRSIIEQIRDPLLHLIRNAVDHGIETPEIRKKAGKPEKGTIRLAAYHEQSHIVVCISDDGAGIDVEKVKQVAIHKEFMTTEAISRLSHSEAQNLIFLNGVSTAEKVTEVSGRGVGMDVVKTNVSNVGGSVSVESKLGEGTAFKLRLPLTLATIDGILVSCGGLFYVVPISVIVKILRLESNQIQRVMGREVIRLRENIIPLIRLNLRFDKEARITLPDSDINIVVIKVGDNISGVIVDAVLEPQESVVKPLGKYIGSLPGISGATIMGDGQVALILDAATLVNESQ